MPAALDPEAISVLTATPTVIRTLLEGLGDRSLQPTGDSWGPRQVLEHLIDTEGIAFRERIGRILDEDAPVIAPIDPPQRLVDGGYATRETAELIKEFATMRRASVEWLNSLDPGKLDRSGLHEVAGPIAAGELVSYWATHDLIHLAQLVKALRVCFVPRIGNMTAFLEDD